MLFRSMDAYRRDVFSALFRVGGSVAFAPDRLEELDPPAVGDPAATLARWRASGQAPDVVVGDGAVLYADVLGEHARVMAPPPLASIIARMAVARARVGDTVDPAGIQPLYVRRPDAEIAREALQIGRASCRERV